VDGLGRLLYLKELTHVWLGSNYLKAIPDFSASPHLQELHLNNNFITYISNLGRVQGMNGVSPFLRLEGGLIFPLV
jgi:Leucine-rich repeat (LRR) protein